jgi:putative molybdopterin biosynthesis protein
MADLLTTDEAASYLRLSERKLYDLIANGAVPCTKVTGRWLFPRAALDRWVMAGLLAPSAMARSEPPPIIGGSQDPLLDWALRESGSGLASLPEGSEEGLRRLALNEVTAAAIHLHRLEGDDDEANTAAVAGMQGLHDAVLIAFVRREQGILVAPGNPLGLSDIGSAATKRARIAQRPPGAGAQLLLVALLSRAALTPDRLVIVKPVCPTGLDVAQAVRAGRADCGIATRSVATAAALDFLPLTWERFDLVFRQRDYFMPGPQALLKFMRSTPFHDRAAELGGYDTAAAGDVRLVH